MARDNGLADRLRADGLKVAEVEGWKSRGSSEFNPKSFVRHHTAGSASGDTPSLSICVNGRPDLSGPLCNIYLGRDRVVYVVASGRANHAGTPDGGSWKGCTGNTTSYGFEIEHTGTSQLAADMHEISARACAAVIRGRFGVDMVCDHKEWSPSRKIDLATGPAPGAFRDLVKQYLKGGGFLMSLTDAQQEELFENSRLAKQFAEGVQQFFEDFAKNGNQIPAMASTIDKPNEIAGWKLAERVQQVRLSTKDD